MPLAITRADHYMANVDWVAITIEFAGEANGIKLNQPCGSYSHRRRKIVEVRLLCSDHAQKDALWGGGSEFLHR